MRVASRRASLLSWLAVAYIARAASADVVPLPWTEATLATPDDSAPIRMQIRKPPDLGGGFDLAELWDPGPFSFSNEQGSVSGIAEFELDGNRWTYSIHNAAATGMYSGASVAFRARFQVPPGDDVEFIGFVDSSAGDPPYETEPSGLTDIRVFVAGDEVTIHRTLGVLSLGLPIQEEYEEQIELFWITAPEPQTSASVATSVATLLALRRKRTRLRILRAI